MIFYFSGTGNSHAAALKLGEKLGEDLTDIGKSVRNSLFDFDLSDGEIAGFVFPVYSGGLPTAVTEFISEMKLSGKPSYVFGLMTYGGSPGFCYDMLNRRLSDAGLKLDAAFGVRMPANCAVLYEPTKPDKEGPLLEEADRKIEETAREVQSRVKTRVSCGPLSRILTDAIYNAAYLKGRKTAPFHTNDKCVHCGICASRCPVNAIKMIDGTPTWVIDQCVFCMSCVRCGAIEYGDKLTDRYRYKHPMLRKASGHDDHEGSSSDGTASHDHSSGEGGSTAHDHSSGKEGSCCDSKETGGSESPGGHDHSSGSKDSCCGKDDASALAASDAKG